MDATFRFNRRVVLAILACFLLASLPTLSAAQEPVQSFDQLNTRLKVGDTVYVTDAHGREIKSKIRDLNSSALTLDQDGDTAYAADDVRQITQRRSKPVGKGALWGLGAGAIGGAVIVGGMASLDDCNGCSVAGFALGGAVICGGIGVGVGALIGSMKSGKEMVVYRAPGTSGNARLSLAPVITRRTKGAAVAFSF